jgi:hypothetical protein
MGASSGAEVAGKPQPSLGGAAKALLTPHIRVEWLVIGVVLIVVSVVVFRVLVRWAKSNDAAKAQGSRSRMGLGFERFFRELIRIVFTLVNGAGICLIIGAFLSDEVLTAMHQYFVNIVSHLRF